MEDVVYEAKDIYKVLIYVDVDENGTIISSITGKNILPDRQYHHYFYRDKYVGDSIFNYKVVITDGIGDLQVIDAELEQRLKDAYFNIDKQILQQEYEIKMAELQALQEQLNTL